MPRELGALQEQLTALVGADHVLTGAAAAACAVDGVAPPLVARPGTQEQVAAALAAAGRAGAAVIARGTGAAMGLGNRPSRLEVVLDLARLNRIGEFDADNLVVTAEAGVCLGDLRQTLAARREFLPLDPAGMERRTVGGVLAANASGPSRLLYGTPRDLVLGLRVALASGERIRCGGKVIKNVSGYDMNKLFIGSLGTLGIITEGTFKLLPVPATRATLAAVFPALDQPEAVVTRTLQSFLLPEALELLDPHAAAAVAPVLGLAGTAGYTLVVSVAGSQETVERQTRDFGGLLGEAGAERTSTLRETDAAAARAAARDALDSWAAGAGRVSVKIVVPISRTAALFRAAERLAQGQTWPGAVSSHAGSGVVRAAYAPGDTPPDAVRDGAEELRREAEAAGGSLILEAAPPSVKSGLDAWGKPCEAFSVMRRLKVEFDPGGVLSPGRFIGGI